MSYPQIAITSQAFTCSGELIDFCREQDCFAVEYTFNRSLMTPQEIDSELPEIRKLSDAGCKLRYHLAFPGREIAHSNPETARSAVIFYEHCLKSIARLGGNFATMHIGLGPYREEEIDYSTAVCNLNRLVSFGQDLGVELALENLRKGRLNPPKNFQKLINDSDAWATLDIGHALAREKKAGRPGYALDYIRHTGPRIREAHVYEIEKRAPNNGSVYHAPPENLDIIQPLLDDLISSSACDYWLIELTDKKSLAHTLELLRNYLSTFPAFNAAV